MVRTVITALVTAAALVLALTEAPARIRRDSEAARSDKSLFDEELGLVDLRGDPVKLRDLGGKLTLVNLWATWCGPCRVETPELVRLHRKYESRRVVIVGVAVDSDTVDIRAFARAYEIKYPLLVGSAKLGRGLSKVGLRMRGVPFTVLLDERGRVLEAYTGAVHGDTLRADIERHLR